VCDGTQIPWAFSVVLDLGAVVYHSVHMLWCLTNHSGDNLYLWVQCLNIG